MNPSMRTALAKLESLGVEFESAGCDQQSFEMTQALRDVRLAASDEIDVTSWDDFRSFFDKNFGSQLIFLMVDKYGENSPLTKIMRDAVKKSNEVDEMLHKLYMQMKQQANPPTQQSGGDAGTENGTAEDTAKALDSLSEGDKSE